MTLSDIPTNEKYEGYLWLSNNTEPTLVTYEQELSLELKDGTFFIEGQLYNSAAHKSLSIKYVDGKYITHQHEVDKGLLELKNSEQKEIKEGSEVKCVVERKDYLSNRMDGRWLKFLRYWEATPAEENCLGMPVLKLTKTVFIGFVNDKEDKS